MFTFFTDDIVLSKVHDLPQAGRLCPGDGSGAGGCERVDLLLDKEQILLDGVELDHLSDVLPTIGEFILVLLRDVASFTLIQHVRMRDMELQGMKPDPQGQYYTNHSAHSGG